MLCFRLLPQHTKDKIGIMSAMKDKIFNTVQPLLSYIDSGDFFRKPFSWLYMALAAMNVLAPFVVLYKTIDSGLFKYGGAKVIFSFFLIWIFVLVAGWVGAQIWWNRREQVLESSSTGSEFSATPTFSHFIQTLGENYGTSIAIVGVGFSLIATVFLGSEAGMMGSGLGLPVNAGIFGVFVFPILGYLVIVFSRFVAEQIRALATIANNTRK